MEFASFCSSFFYFRRSQIFFFQIASRKPIQAKCQQVLISQGLLLCGTSEVLTLNKLCDIHYWNCCLYSRLTYFGNVFFVEIVHFHSFFACINLSTCMRKHRSFKHIDVKQWCSNFLARGPHLSFRNPSRVTRINNLNKNSLKNSLKWLKCKVFFPMKIASRATPEGLAGHGLSTTDVKEW